MFNTRVTRPVSVMIRYTIQCTAGHRSEGWFASAAAFDAQASSGAIACPICGDTTITRAPMAPQIVRRSTHPRPQDAEGAADRTEAPAGGTGGAVAKPDAPTPAPVPVPDQAQAQVALRTAMVMAAVADQLRAVRTKIESTCDYVGDRFAEEARAIHYGEVEERGIYGEATADEAEALADEGVEVARIPWLPPDH